MTEGLFARATTSKGEILIKLEYEKVPGTVGNFVGLAEGEIENQAVPKGEPYYNGLKFHRVIPNFMIQGGDPQSTGAGGPGYKFEDEIHSDLKHDRPGVLSMANAGPGTNGSQFFITHQETPWLDTKHTVFGYVVEGQEVVDAIQQGDEIEKLEIIRKGEAAQNFDAVAAFQEFKNAQKNREVQAKEKQEAELKKLTEGLKKTNSGLCYSIESGAEGIKAEKGKLVAVHYKGMLSDGTVFDSSYKRNEPIEFPLGKGHVIKGWDEGIQLLKEGDRARFVIPAHLGYGAHGAGGVIPPHATLIFDVELVAVK